MVLENLINTATFVSLPLRHFEIEMMDTRRRKNLRITKGVNKTISAKNISLMFQENLEGN
jgi:hypothetical protein